MAYKITVDNQHFLGYTIPGAAPMRIAYSSSQEFNDPFIADFMPDSDTLLSDNPSGQWFSVQPGVDEEFLERLKPEVVAACRRRRLNILKSNLGLPKEQHPEWLEKSGDEVLARYQKNALAIRTANLDFIAKIIEP